MLMKGTFRDDPLGPDDAFPTGKYQSKKVLYVLAHDPAYILKAIRFDSWHFTDAVKDLAKDAI